MSAANAVSSQHQLGPRLIKADCGAEASVDEFRAAQLDMLSEFNRYCEEHGFDCYLSGGTLLGAVRHKGFIPWDDDIDVNCPRPHCQKIMEQTGGVIGRYRFAEPDMDQFSRSCESYRLYDFNYIIESYSGGASKTPHYYPLFIDVFPIEGLPSDDKTLKSHYAKIVALRKLARVASLKHMEGGSVAAHVWHLAAWVPAKIAGYTRLSQAIQRVATTYDFDECERVGVMTAPIHTVEECVMKRDYVQKTNIVFEGRNFYAPGNAHTYLSQLYGDYMQLPPEEKRRSHHSFKVYRRKSS